MQPCSVVLVVMGEPGLNQNTKMWPRKAATEDTVKEAVAGEYSVCDRNEEMGEQAERRTWDRRHLNGKYIVC